MALPKPKELNGHSRCGESKRKKSKRGVNGESTFQRGVRIGSYLSESSQFALEKASFFVSHT